MKQSLGLVALVVRDYDEALAFFVGKLGFTLVEDSLVPAQAKRWVDQGFALTMAVTPVAANLGGRLLNRIEGPAAASLSDLDAQTGEVRNHVVVIGFGQVGMAVTRHLVGLGIPVLALDFDPKRVRYSQAHGLPVYFGNAARADVLVFGVRFRPDGARGFLGFDLDAATDKRIDLAAEHGDATTALREALWGESHLESRLGLIEDYVEARIAASGRSVDPVVRAVVMRVLAGEAPPADLGISERQLQRRFRAEVDE